MLDKVNEKRTMGTERILFILEDLHKLEDGVNSRIVPLVRLRLEERGADNSDKDHAALIGEELKLRFKHISDPCIQAISLKVSVRLQDNVQIFKQVA